MVDAEAVRNWVIKVENELGIPGIIVANAATVTFAGIHEITPEQWARDLRVNLDGAFHLTQSADSTPSLSWPTRAGLCLLVVGLPIQCILKFLPIVFPKRA